MEVTQWGAEEWAAFGQVGGMVVAVIAGGLVLWQIRQGQQVREDQSRPYVIVDFSFDGLSVNLAISNTGTTPARDVSIVFDKQLVSPDRDRHVADFDVFNEPIPMMAPGRVILVRFGQGPDFFKPEAPGVPLNYQATVTYTDLSGKRAYHDPPLLLDLVPYKRTVITPDHLSDVSKSLRDIKKTLSGWSAHGGVKVLATDVLEKERRTDRNDHRWDLRHAYQERGLRGVVAWEWSRLKERLRD